MPFPYGWGRRCKLTIDHLEVSENQSNFPWLLHHDNLPSEMFDADGLHPALNGGGDVRFSSDRYGYNRLSIEVKTFITDNNPDNGVAEIWVKIPSVSTSIDTDIWVWYNKSGESQPARDAASGGV